MDKREDLQAQINVLKIKLEAAEAIHAVLIGMIIRFLPVKSDKFLEQVRKSIRVSASAPTSTAAEDAKMLHEQYEQEAVDKIETASEQSRPTQLIELIRRRRAPGPGSEILAYRLTSSRPSGPVHRPCPF